MRLKNIVRRPGRHRHQVLPAALRRRPGREASTFAAPEGMISHYLSVNVKRFSKMLFRK
jgi:hypothetical protein